ncbi:hypothetical protein HCQ94_03300 [Actinomyces sp. zg-332]|uniref:hypothetical protein n=1 Tax=Actinomyces sp. zg-332 TaxID=2708340 RepID=UPI00141F2E08|nr:hypothetical protein [Actinomyces sp. zg-332]QPK93633.1 hypothetical protein HCQ94_03300 [Actinomyces sp. zg-332]
MVKKLGVILACLILAICVFFIPVKAILLYSALIGFLCLLAVLGIFIYYSLMQKNRPIPYTSYMSSLLLCFFILVLPYLTVTFITWAFITVSILASGYYFYYVTYKKEKLNVFYFIFSLVALIFSVLMLFNYSLVSELLVKVIVIFTICYIANNLFEADNVGQKYYKQTNVRIIESKNPSEDK